VTGSLDQVVSSQEIVISEGWDGPWYRIRTPSFEASFLVGTAGDPDQEENVDVDVRLADGSRWSATMFTVAEVKGLMARWAETGECGGGSYFWCADGLIVGEKGVRAMTRVLLALQDSGEITDVLKPLD
jgi:hypothetical protein